MADPFFLVSLPDPATSRVEVRRAFHAGEERSLQGGELTALQERSEKDRFICSRQEVTIHLIDIQKDCHTEETAPPGEPDSIRLRV